MRRRFLLSIVGVTLVAVVVLGVSVAYLLDRLARGTEQARLQRNADGIALSLEGLVANGREPTATELTTLAPYGDRLVLRRRGGTTLTVGSAPAPPVLIARTTITEVGELELVGSAEAVENRVQSGVLSLGFLAIAALAASAAVAMFQARRLALPLEALSRVSNRLGAGDFSAVAPRSGITEFDAVADALDISSARIAAMIRAEREFSTNASHQLRSALTGLILHVEELAASPDPDVATEAGAALVQAERLDATIENLLNLARTGRSGERRDVDLVTLSGDHVIDWRPRFERAGRQVLLRGHGRPSVVATPGAIGQTLDILLSNSLVHGAGTTRVTVHDDGAGPTVEVSDEGTGIPESRVSSLFNRPDATPDGHGIGLPLARLLVQTDGGSLELADASTATFRIRLTRVTGGGDTADPMRITARGSTPPEPAGS